MTEKATAQDVIDTLRSIDQSLKHLVAHFGARRMDSNVPPSRPDDTQAKIAPDRDLDGKHGDPAVRYDPRDWSGESFIGAPLSECSIEYLDVLAASWDNYANWAEREGKTTSTGKPIAPYKRMDAARARGWAERKRTGWKPPVQADGFPSDASPAVNRDDDDIPF